MARPTLDRNPKFKLLMKRLALPRPYVRGILECLWDACHESGVPIFRSGEHVEAVCDWAGDPNSLAGPLVEVGFLDAMENGELQVHDYWDHAPDYVKSRRRQEEKRKESSRQFERVPNNSEKFASPAPAPAPAPAHHDPRQSPTQGPSSRSKRAHHREAECVSFNKFWTDYPRKVAKPAAARAWSRLNPTPELVEKIMNSVAAQTRSPEWQRDGGRYVPHPATWLGNERWNDELPVEKDLAIRHDSKTEEDENDGKFI